MNHEELAEALLTENLPFEHARRILAEAGIADPVKANKNIQLLAGRGTAYEVFCRILPLALGFLDKVADPDMALNNWERLVEVKRDRETHFRNIKNNPQALDILLRIIGVSQYLADILIRKPSLFSEMIMSGHWRDLVETDTLRSELAEIIAGAPDYERKLTALRDFKNRHVLRIGIKDICGETDVEEILRETTSLANMCVRTALDIAESEVRTRFGKPMIADKDGEASVVIMALGKLGGEELNYSSDIDLIFIYSHEGETQAIPASEEATGSVANHEYFSKLAEKCIELLSRVTEQGHLFRVDMRLRPMGSKGPLVSSLESHLSYYEIFGETWERQALLKARPVAGDMELGLRFLKEIRPFVYPKYLDHRGIREIQELKRRIEREVDKQGRAAAEVKLGRGGIRDIEFTVQFLQLLNGGKHPELRGTNTLGTLRMLERISYLSPAECAALIEAYRFLRKIENRLQIMQNRQLHVLPSRMEDAEVVARSLGYQRSAGRSAARHFELEYKRHTEKVRELFNKFFGKMFAGGERVSPVIDLILNPEPTEVEIEETLGRYGFRNCVAAYENLVLLADGPVSSPNPPRSRTFFCNIAPLLLQHLEQSPDPDMALNNLQRCVAALGAPATFYEILSANPKSLELFVALSSYSDHLIRLLVNDPGVIDFLMSTRILEGESSRLNIDKALGKFLDINPNFYESIQRFKNGELLRIGLRDILGLADIIEVTRELSSVAEVMLARVYQKCLEEHVTRYGEPLGENAVPAIMTILGMGKIGGAEINYASDLDVVFVYSSDGQTTGGTSGPISCQQFFVTLAARIMKRMSELNPYGYLYKMDARLRPDGDQGLLAVSADSFVEYHRQKSALWEKRAMTKMRPVAGDAALGAHIRDVAHSIIYAPGFFTAEVVEDAIAMLRKIFEAVRTEEREGVQIKNAAGGIVEIEFLVQLLQLKYGHEQDDLSGANPSGAVLRGEKNLHPSSDRYDLRTTNTLEALDALGAAGYLSRQTHDDLTATLVLLRRVENRLRLMHDRSLNELPSDPDALDKLALRLGTTASAERSPGEALLDTLESYIHRSHRVFEELMTSLRQKGS
ncbi:bifunctional [glutamate--ammonia ligase]-adenylyl-L-tyrosine phosphorylase/[glutamate--ammonia-ligase] adenylyltransferase [Candidatus Poribacteria bacterium]|nr:bifunctional [glutamate--ammonia ligase]-adenylyl-L-tyrosine phosphorylase/[glutamate--ammonia-ligase] adenylyltransferase [Candidatus Poribacteria bacterium]